MKGCNNKRRNEFYLKSRKLGVPVVAMPPFRLEIFQHFARIGNSYILIRLLCHSANAPYFHIPDFSKASHYERYMPPETRGWCEKWKFMTRISSLDSLQLLSWKVVSGDIGTAARKWFFSTKHQATQSREEFNFFFQRVLRTQTMHV